MRTILFLSIIALSLLLFSCQKETKHSGYVDDNEALVENLTEVKGNSRTYNYDFKILEEPKSEGVNYYEPSSIIEGFASIPKEMRDAIYLPTLGELPFTTGTKKANIVTFWNDSNKLIFEIQISFFENDAEYHANNQDFFIISATQLADNPFVDTSADNDPIDDWREKFNVDGTDSPEEVVIYRDLKLNPDLPLFYRNLVPDWPRMYAYYSYDGVKIVHRSAGAKIYYAWYDGVLFQIGCKFDDDDTTDMEAVVRKIILGE